MNNQKGMTLLELLVVVVILSILATIAVLGFSSIIQKANDDAFVANAYSLKNAAENYYYSSGSFSDDSNFPKVILLKDLVNAGFIDTFKDPDTRETMPVEENTSFVRIEKKNGVVRYYICYKGIKRQLCGENENGEPQGVLFEEINTSIIRELDLSS